MNEKITYQAPEVELMEIGLEGRLMTLSSGISQAPNVVILLEDDIVADPQW